MDIDDAGFSPEVTWLMKNRHDLVFKTTPRGNEAEGTLKVVFGDGEEDNDYRTKSDLAWCLSRNDYRDFVIEYLNSIGFSPDQYNIDVLTVTEDGDAEDFSVSLQAEIYFYEEYLDNRLAKWYNLGIKEGKHP